jgi:transcriptional regulator with XRE-family HTH domain
MCGVNITETLRTAIQRTDVSRYEIAKATGIAQSALSRFIHGERGLDGDSINKLCQYFGLELRPIKSNRKDK